ncbi:MAG: tetratricopeptide repeat protein [Hormoscilla sp.]
MEFNPDDERIWLNRGIVLRDSGKVEKALISFERAIKIKPEGYKYWVKN